MCLRDTLIRLSIWDGTFPGMNMHLNNPICYGELVILNWASKLFSNTFNYLKFVGCRQRGWVWTFSNFSRDTIPLLCSSLTFWCCIKRLHSAKGNLKFNLFSYSVPHLQATSWDPIFQFLRKGLQKNLGNCRESLIAEKRKRKWEKK